MTTSKLSYRFSLAIHLSIIAAVILPIEAYAQLEEVVVTARKRVESLQETPLSVVSFSPEALEKQNISDLGELNSKLPNVFIGPGGGLGANNGSFYMRGLGANRNAINQESAVALYIDDAYYGRSDGALLQVLDVEAIEVLRGPQGTLFGRNATAGAIRYITKKPDDEFGGKLQVTFGEDERIDVKGSVNVPVTDMLAVRLTAATLNQDGFQTNALGQDLGDRGTDLVRAYARLNASDSIEILGSVDYTSTDHNGSAYSVLAVNDARAFAGGAGNGVAQARLNGFVVDESLIGSTTQSGSTTRAFNDTETLGGSLTINWDISDSLRFKWASTYREIDIHSAFDFDAVDAVLLENGDVDRDSESWSTELQLSGDLMDSRLRWLVGFYYYEEESDDVRFAAGDWVPPFVAGPFSFLAYGTAAASASTRINTPHELESMAGFGQVSFDITDKFSITGGIRYTSDDKRIHVEELNAAGAPLMFLPGDPNGPGPLIIDRADSWSAMSGRVSLEYAATEDIFLFASYARGFRAGGINDRARPFYPPELFYGVSSFDEETVDTFELGVRSQLFDNRFRFNATLFYNDFKNLQIASQVGAIVVVGNAGAANNAGIEIESIWQVTDSFSLDLTLGGYFESEYTEGGAQIVDGTQMENTPDIKFNIGADYTIPLGSGTLDFRLDYAYTDNYTSVAAAVNLWPLDSYDTLNGNIRYTSEDKTWAISVYGNNMLDEDYFTQALNFINVPPSGTAAGSPMRGSEFGAKFEYNF